MRLLRQGIYPQEISTVAPHLMRIAVYPGTFDPITKGHMDIIQRAVGIADKLVIAVAEDIPKTPLFDIEERAEMIRHDVAALKDAHRIEVSMFKGLLVDFAKQQNASIIIRGLRAVSDFEYEFQLASMNNRLNNQVQTVFLPAAENLQFIASRIVKEVARLGGDIRPFVSENVANHLLARVR